jgi:hypothetical protein
VLVWIDIAIINNKKGHPMKLLPKILTLALIIFVSGCAVTPQTPVTLNQQTIKSKNDRIGVAMTALPKIDTYFPGADCLLCLAAASVANSSLTKHAHTLKYDTLPKLPEEVANILKKQGAEVYLITDELNLNDLKSASTKGENVALKDFSPLKEKYNITKLLVIEINRVGFVRTYASYFATSDPKATIQGNGFIVDLAKNTYDWYLPVNVTKSAENNWDEPEEFPDLTNSYFQAIEIGKDSFLKPLSESKAVSAEVVQ